MRRPSLLTRSLITHSEKRGNRVVLLASNIGQFQSEVIDSLDLIDTRNGHIKEQMDLVPTAHWLQSLEEVKNKLMGLLTPQQKAAYEASVKILDASFMMTVIAGTKGSRW